MPIDKKLYQSVIPLKGDATKVYSKNSIRQAINENDYFVVGGKKVLKSSLNLNKGTLKEIPSDYVEKANKKDAVLEKIGWQNKAGKPAILHGLAKTVGASAAMATGAAYSTPVVGTLGGLARNIVAGGVGAEGFAMLEGRPAKGTELATGAAMEMGMPLAVKGVENALPIIKNGINSISKNGIIQNPMDFLSYHLKSPSARKLVEPIEKLHGQTINGIPIRYKPTLANSFELEFGNKSDKVGNIEAMIFENAKKEKVVQPILTTLKDKYRGQGKMREIYSSLNEKLNNGSNNVFLESDYSFLSNPNKNGYPAINMWEDFVRSGKAKRMGPDSDYVLPISQKGLRKNADGTYGVSLNSNYRMIADENKNSSIPIKTKPIIESTSFQIERPTTNTLQLKSTMMGSPLEKQLSKDGMLSINSLQAYLNNPSTSMADRTMIRKVLDERFAGQPKINYNDFRKAVSDEMVPLEKNFDSAYSNYGIGSLGYPGVKKESIEKSIKFGVDDLKSNLKGNLQSDGTYLKDYEKIKWNIDQLRKNKKLLSETPRENTSIVYSNKEKFGRGSTDHFENEGTLGHSRILVSNEEKDVMHVLEQQSDFYQKNPYSKLLENKNRSIDGEYDQDIIQYWTKKVEDYEKGQINPIQKELLGKTHQERLLQENVAHAAQNGQTKMRYPTPETAAKIQGYTPKKVLDENKFDIEVKNKLADYQKKMSDIGDEDFKYTNESRTKSVRLGRILDTQYPMKAGETPEETIINLQNKYGDDAVSIYKEYRTLQQKDHAFDIDIDKRKFYLRREIADYKNELSSNPKYQKNIFESAHETILKKYADNPKMIKKILGQDTRTVTDSKGNSWYEFDIPEAFRKGKAEIKALSTIGAIATGYKAIVDKNKK